MKGEPRPVENTFYKGYSPPKCTCNVHSTFHNHIPTRTCQLYMESYMSCHEMRCDSPCTMRPSLHRLPHTMPQLMSDKPSFWMTSNDQFQNKFHLFINLKAFWMIHHNDHFIFKSISCSKSCAFMWVVDFWCLTTGFANPNTFRAFHR